MNFLAAWLIATAQVFAQTPATLNLSHDLVSNGIAKSNMTPDSPTLDSRQLFEAGVNYANSHHIPTVTVDRGRYYFLTQDNANQHVNISASNLTIDLQYSDLYFANGNAVGLVCNLCSGMTLENFTLDYINLPFTQVQVTGVNSTARTITYQTISGWPSPSSLNSFATPAANEYLFVAGAGEVPVTLMVDGQSANTVTVNIQ
jgi:hypothetical protein